MHSLSRILIDILVGGSAILFLLAAAAKLNDRLGLATTIRAIIPVGRRSANFIAMAIIGAELVAACAMSIGYPSGVQAAIALLLLFAAVATSVALSKTSIACRCFGALSQSRLGLSTVIRNVVWAVGLYVAYIAMIGESPDLQRHSILTTALVGCCLLLAGTYSQLHRMLRIFR